MRNTFLFIIIVILIGLGGWFIARELGIIKTTTTTQINSYEECIQAGNPSMESYPPQCRTEDGRTFTQQIDDGNAEEVNHLIQLDTPKPNEVITSPLTISGKARGPWYFEANFPAKVVDANGNVLGQAGIQAEGEWMTEDFVMFNGTITFTTPTTDTGTLVLEKDNPSGLLENDNNLTIPVKFK